MLRPEPEGHLWLFLVDGIPAATISPLTFTSLFRSSAQAKLIGTDQNFSFVVFGLSNIAWPKTGMVPHLAGELVGRGSPVLLSPSLAVALLWGGAREGIRDVT
jgi:hypothetical protein